MSEKILIFTQLPGKFLQLIDKKHSHFQRQHHFWNYFFWLFFYFSHKYFFKLYTLDARQRLMLNFNRRKYFQSRASQQNIFNQILSFFSSANRRKIRWFDEKIGIVWLGSVLKIHREFRQSLCFVVDFMLTRGLKKLATSGLQTRRYFKNLMVHYTFSNTFVWMTTREVISNLLTPYQSIAKIFFENQESSRPDILTIYFWWSTERRVRTIWWNSVAGKATMVILGCVWILIFTVKYQLKSVSESWADQLIKDAAKLFVKFGLGNFNRFSRNFWFGKSGQIGWIIVGFSDFLRVVEERNDHDEITCWKNYQSARPQNKINSQGCFLGRVLRNRPIVGISVFNKNLLNIHLFLAHSGWQSLKFFKFHFCSKLLFLLKTTDSSKNSHYEPIFQ